LSGNRPVFAVLDRDGGCLAASDAPASHQMRSPIEPSAGLTDARPGALEAALDRLFGDGVRPLRLEEAIFEAMLDGWARQQRSRLLREATIRSGVRLVRRVANAAERWPWEWTAADLEDFISDLASAPYDRRPATLRNYQSQLRGFLEYLVDERYAWRLVCAGCFGRMPVQLLDEYNAIVHVSARIHRSSGVGR
jgi:hypothetical protein